ncbi:MAG: membrane protein insertase YidC [Candidatus Omnitrophota bacterium]
MEKRMVLAIALSLGVLLIWSVLMPKPQSVVVQDVMSKEALLNKQNPLPLADMTQLAKPESESFVKYEQSNLEVIFYERLAALKEVIFKSYGNHSFPLKYGLLLNDPKLEFKKSQITEDSISFVAVSPGRRITKKFKFNKSNYTIDLEIIIQNLSSVPLKLETSLLLGIIDLSSKNSQVRYQDLTVAMQDKTIHMGINKDTEQSGIKFLGFRDQYFAAILEPVVNNASIFVNKLSKQESEIGLNVQTENVPSGGQIGHLYHIYIGPQDVSILNVINPAWSALVHYGTFDVISQILLQALGFLHKIVHNWGLAIILLSILVYLILYPLSIKQMRSMKEMQVLQPKVEELRKAYKDNPQKMNQEIMALYKEHKVNPLGGCLPLLLQMPIFFALYNALMRSIVLKGAKFLWINDLSEPDRLIIFPKALPILGSDLNILPIIMAIGMFVQQKISSASSSGTSAEQQKIMLIVMPVMFGLIFYRMPSGLVLYWFVNSTLMLIFQMRMNRAR